MPESVSIKDVDFVQATLQDFGVLTPFFGDQVLFGYIFNADDVANATMFRLCDSFSASPHMSDFPTGI
ncbi:MAG: hypothetical protein ACPGLY_06180 [Rubripirellula sp.]